MPFNCVNWRFLPLKICFILVAASTTVSAVSNCFSSHATAFVDPLRYLRSFRLQTAFRRSMGRGDKNLHRTIGMISTFSVGLNPNKGKLTTSSKSPWPLHQAAFEDPAFVEDTLNARHFYYPSNEGVFSSDVRMSNMDTVSFNFPDTKTSDL